MLSPARKTLALICAIALVVVTVPSFFVPPAEAILFQPAPYQQQLAKQDVYIWKVEGKYSSGQTFLETGDVTLMH